MRARLQRVLFVVAAVLAAVVAGPAVDAPGVRALGDNAVVALVVVTVAIIVLSQIDTTDAHVAGQPDIRNLDENEQRLNDLIRTEAERAIAGTTRLGGLIGSLRPARRGGGAVRVPAPRTRAILLGEPGSGKSTTLSIITSRFVDEMDRPVVMLRLGDWLEPSVAPRARDQHRFERWLQSVLDKQFRVHKEVIDWWLRQDLLVVVLDGLDELELGARIDATAAIEEFLRQHPANSVIVSCRRAEYAELGVDLPLEVWEMPDLDLEEDDVIERADSMAPQLESLGAAHRSVLFSALKQPLWLFLLLNVVESEIPVLETPGDYQDWLIAAFARRIGADDPTGELSSVAGWMATALGDKQAVTFDVAAISFSMLPPAGRWTAQVYQGIRIAVFSNSYTLPAGLLAGLGWFTPVFSLAYALGLAGLGATPLGRRVIERIDPPRILRVRRWNPWIVLRRVRRSGRPALRRLVAGLILGCSAGLVLVVVNEAAVPSWFDGPVGRWSLIVAMPLLCMTIGALPGGLAAGVLLAVVIHLDDAQPVLVAGGVTAGVVTAIVFGAAYYGEVVQPFGVAADARAVEQLLSSAWRSMRFDVVTWASYGLVYGGAMLVVSGGNILWLDHGLLVGAGGAFIYTMIAFTWPRVTVYGVQHGLVRAGVLRTSDLESVLFELQSREILLPVIGGAAYRFFHPLLERYLRQHVNT